MNIAVWLASISWPIVSRILAQLGIGIVSYAAVAGLVTSAINSAKASYSGMIPVIAQFFALAGINTALGIIAGAIAARLTYSVFKRFQIK